MQERPTLAELSNRTTSAPFVANVRVFAAARYIPLEGIVEPDGMKDVAVTVLESTRGWLTVTVPEPADEPIFTVVVELASPPVPTLTVLVFPENVAPLAKEYVVVWALLPKVRAVPENA